MIVYRGGYSGLQQVFIALFPVLAAFITLYVGVYPFILLAKLVRAELDKTLAPFMAGASARSDEWGVSPGFPEVMASYQYFRSLRVLPIRVSALVQYVTGIIASLFVFMVQRFISA